MMPSVVFWLSVGSIFYAYVGYPLVLMAFSPFLRKPVQKGEGTPRVTLIVSAYNEEATIARKLENSLTLDYPRELVEVMVVSDASTDRTDEIVRERAAQGVRLFRVEGRVGKTACLNLAVPEAKGEIVVFSDANSVFHPGALRELAANFADPAVGCVTGHTKYLSGKGSGHDVSLGIYARMERAVKRMESRIGSCVGADGAIFAVRKELYQPLMASDINDFVIPLNVIRQGFRTVLEERAWCWEEAAPDPRGEYSRQVRITNRTLRAIFKKKALILGVFERRLHTAIFPFELFSHKVVKFLVPLFMALTLTSSLALTRARGSYRAVILLQGAFYGLAILEQGAAAVLLEKVMAACRTFTVANAAILNGWITYARGEDFITWKSQR